MFFGCQLQKALQVFIEPFNFRFFSITGQAQTWITMILNGSLWKQTEIMLSFLRLHPNTELQTQGSVESAALIQKSCKDTVILLTVVKNTHIKSNQPCDPELFLLILKLVLPRIQENMNNHLVQLLFLSQLSLM